VVFSHDTLYVPGIEVKKQQLGLSDYVCRFRTPLVTSELDAVHGHVPNNDVSSTGIANPFRNMAAQGLLDKNNISISFAQTIPDRSHPGKIAHGGINKDQYRGDLKYVPLLNVADPNGLWDACEGHGTKSKPGRSGVHYAGIKLPPNGSASQLRT
jgi:hypothetical protein